jgi:hypothetical protein
MMVETKNVQRERLGAAARLLACRYKAFEMICLMYHLFAINSISFSYIHRPAYHAILRAQARPPGTLRWERPGRIWWRLQQSQPGEYWQRVLGVHPSRSPREKWCRSLETRLRPRPPLNWNSLASLGLRPVVRGRIVAQMHRPLQRRFR